MIGYVAFLGKIRCISVFNMELGLTQRNGSIIVHYTWYGTAVVCSMSKCKINYARYIQKLLIKNWNSRWWLVGAFFAIKSSYSMKGISLSIKRKMIINHWKPVCSGTHCLILFAEHPVLPTKNQCVTPPHVFSPGYAMQKHSLQMSTAIHLEFSKQIMTNLQNGYPYRIKRFCTG